jgi:hypothetical protein
VFIKELNIFPQHLRENVVTDGPDFGWPLEQAAEVIQSLVDAKAVILGVEAWIVDEAGVPASVGWSFYDLGEGWDKDWDDAVARSKVEAEEVLAGVMETAVEDGVNYVGIDWTFTVPEQPEELRVPEWLGAQDTQEASERPEGPAEE